MTNLNFAEAALLIQGSACIYSKKVEYLYALLYKTLDILIEKRQQQSSSVDKKGKDKDAEFPDEPDFLELDDILEETTGNNIDLNDELDDDYASKRSSTLMTRAPLSLIAGSRIANEESINDFRISNCVVHQSGALLLEEKSQHQISESFVRTDSADDKLFGSPSVVLADADGSTGHLDDVNNMNADLGDDGDIPDAPVFDDFGYGGDDPHDDEYAGDRAVFHAAGEADNNVVSLQHADGGGYGLDDLDFDDDDDEEDEEDPWEMMDPHDDSVGSKPKPFVKGRTFTKPRMPAAANQSMLSFMTDNLMNLDSSASDANTGMRALRMPFFNEFSDSFLEELQRQKIRKRKTQSILVQMSRQRARARMLEAEMAARDGNDEHAPLVADGGAMDDDYDFGGDFDGGDDMMPDDIGFDGFDGDEFKMDLSAALSADASMPLDVPKTYEQLCREHVAQYIQSAEKYASETKLSVRVAEWQDKLTPVLAAEEERKPYDIHESGADVLDTLAANKEDEDDQEFAMDFGDVVHGSEKFQVCRAFLACLQLANNGNVDIIPQPHADVTHSSILLRPLSEAISRPDFGGDGNNNNQEASLATEAKAEAEVEAETEADAKQPAKASSGRKKRRRRRKKSKKSKNDTEHADTEHADTEHADEMNTDENKHTNISHDGDDDQQQTEEQEQPQVDFGVPIKSAFSASNKQHRRRTRRSRKSVSFAQGLDILEASPATTRRLRSRAAEVLDEVA
jgi:condensin-2 complex subunit H2